MIPYFILFSIFFFQIEHRCQKLPCNSHEPHLGLLTYNPALFHKILLVVCFYPRNTIYSPNAGLMLGQRLVKHACHETMLQKNHSHKDAYNNSPDFARVQDYGRQMALT